MANCNTKYSMPKDSKNSLDFNLLLISSRMEF